MEQFVTLPQNLRDQPLCESGLGKVIAVQSVVEGKRVPNFKDQIFLLPILNIKLIKSKHTNFT